MCVADMQKTTQNLEVFYFLALKIPFKLMSIIFWSYSAGSCLIKIKVAVESS